MTKYSPIESQFAMETLCQLFFDGPTWDGHLASKTGRDILVDVGDVVRTHGFQYLTLQGIEHVIALGWHTKKMGPKMTAYEAWKKIRPLR